MKVRELIEKLQEFDPETEVLLSHYADEGGYLFEEDLVLVSEFDDGWENPALILCDSNDAYMRYGYES